MLSRIVLKNAGAAAHYYERDDYYAKNDEAQAPSKWWGKGAERLGLEGPVDRKVFQSALSGVGPDGNRLRQGGAGRAGVDLTFSAPKSVSLEALVFGKTDVLEAHHRAVDAALRYLEENGGACARVTVQEETEEILTDNLLVTKFVHETSRELDPQLHTHAIVLNTTQRPDGEWRALHNEGLFAPGTIRAAGGLYRAHLADELQRLGYKTRVTRADGLFELDGYSDEQLRAFSTRREAIEAKLQGTEHSMWDAQRAVLESRPKKEAFDRDVLKTVWQAAVKDVEIEAALPRVPEADAKGDSRDRLVLGRAAVEAALGHLTERQTVVTERQLMAEAMVRAVGRVSPDAVFAGLRTLREDGALLDAKPAKSSPVMPRFTTREAIRTERSFLAAAKRARGKFAPILSSSEGLEADLAKTNFTAGQKEAIRLALLSSDGVVGVQGYAGTGKTTMLREVRERAEAAGFVVRGLAPSARAADALRDEAGIEANTIAKHLLQSHGAKNKEAKGPVLYIIDEASMIGNRDATRLLLSAEKEGARVVLVGDRQQLPAVEAGRAFALLQDRGMRTATMQEIRRQKDPELKRAVEAIVEKRHEEALRRVERYIEEVPDRDARLERVADAYLTSKHRAETIVLTSTNQARVQINELVREGLRAEGVIKSDEVIVRTLVSKGFTENQRLDAREYEVGDVVRFNRAYRRGFSVERGEMLKVLRVDAERNEVTMQRADGQEVPWSPHKAAKGRGMVEVYREEARGLSEGDLVRFTRNDSENQRKNGQLGRVVSVDDREVIVNADGRIHRLLLEHQHHLDHGYAKTVHGAQGETARSVIAELDTKRSQLMGHESFYVTVSRAREEVRLFTNDAEGLPVVLRKTMAQEAALEAFKMPTAERMSRGQAVTGPGLPRLPELPNMPSLERWIGFENRR